MTDPNNLTPTNDPQDLINQALGTATPPTTPLPTPEPLQPTELPTEPAAPPTTPEPVAAEPAPVTPDLPPMNEVETQKPVGDDMPLAFAAVGADTTTTPNMMSAPVIEPVTPAVVPPILTSPVTNNEMGGKKKQGVMGKLATLVGVLALFVGILGATGYWAYNEYGTINPITIAGVSQENEDSCNGCTCETEGCGGGWKRWDKKTQSCKVTGICNSGKDDKDTDDPNGPEEADNESACNSSNGTWCSSTDSNGASYGFCIADTNTRGCNNEAIDRGYSIVYGSGVSTGPVPGGTECNCGGQKTVYFTATNGVCDNGDAAKKGYSTSDGYYDKYGLCAVAGYFDADGNYVYGKKLDKNGNEYDITKYFDKFVCDQNGCRVTDLQNCRVYRYTCNERTSSSCLKGEEDMGGGANFRGKCGTVEQIDVACNGYYIQSRTKLNGECAEEEEIVDNPTHYICNTTTYQCQEVDGAGENTCATDADCVNSTLMCESLTRTPTTTPVIGDTLTFTCKGTDSPAGSTKLTYQYRYQINGGAWQSMITDKSLTPKGTLTIASCGSYKVQCRACGTIKGTQVCDPVWTGASAQ